MMVFRPSLNDTYQSSKNSYELSSRSMDPPLPQAENSKINN